MTNNNIPKRYLKPMETTETYVSDRFGWIHFYLNEKNAKRYRWKGSKLYRLKIEWEEIDA